MYAWRSMLSMKGLMHNIMQMRERERRVEEEKDKAYSEAFSLFMYVYSISSSLLNVVSFIVVFWLLFDSLL